jgi:hypothetical protein
MDLTIYKHNLSKLSDTEFAQESKRIAAIKKVDEAHGNALYVQWMIEMDKRHPLVTKPMPAGWLTFETIV